MKAFEEISTIAFLEMIEKSLGYVFMLAFFEKFFLCPEILKIFSKNVSKIGQHLNLAPKLKKQFSARQELYIGFKPQETS